MLFYLRLSNPFTISVLRKFEKKVGKNLSVLFYSFAREFSCIVPTAGSTRWAMISTLIWPKHTTVKDSFCLAFRDVNFSPKQYCFRWQIIRQKKFSFFVKITVTFWGKLQRFVAKQIKETSSSRVKTKFPVTSLQAWTLQLTIAAIHMFLISREFWKI